jgi:hypothetical protein
MPFLQHFIGSLLSDVDRVVLVIFNVVIYVFIQELAELLNGLSYLAEMLFMPAHCRL